MAKHNIIRVKVSEVFADFDRNFRDPVLDYEACMPTPGYDHEKFLAGNMKAGLFEDILHNGVLTPIWVVILTAVQRASIKARTGKDYLYRVIRGHKRMFTVQKINELFPGKIETLDVDAYEGLSDMEEWELLADHGPTRREEGLSDIGEFRAAVNLFAAGFSQERIAQMFGQSRGWAMRRVWIHQMGRNTPIEANYLARFNPKAAKGSYLSFPLSDVDELHKAWTADNDAGHDPMAEGSLFAAKWKKYAETGKQDRKPKALDRKALEERAGFVEGRPALEEMLRFAMGSGGNAKDAADMYDRVNVKAERAEAAEAEVQTVRADRDSIADRLSKAEARIAELVAENEALRAELVEARKPQAAPAKGGKPHAGR